MFPMPFPEGAADTPQFFYNVTHAVGPGCPNMNDDVSFVQLLLMLLYSDPSLTPPDSRQLSLDGICGPITCAYILGFQKEAVRKGYPLRTDGRIDPATSGRLKGSISHTFYTILSLNASVYKRFPELYGETPFDNLAAFLTAVRLRVVPGVLYG